MEFKDIVSLLFMILVPIALGLISFAYANPRGYAKAKNDLVKYVYFLWYIITAIILIFWSAAKLNWITVNALPELIKFIDEISGCEIVMIILLPPMILWVVLLLFGNASKYRDSKLK